MELIKLASALSSQTKKIQLETLRKSFVKPSDATESSHVKVRRSKSIESVASVLAKLATRLTLAFLLVGAIGAIICAIAHPAARYTLLAIATQELVVGTKSPANWKKISFRQTNNNIKTVHSTNNKDGERQFTSIASTRAVINGDYDLRQWLTSSSDPSLQSFSWSHCHRFGMHRPLLHRNWSWLHVFSVGERRNSR